jgi:hypothetical protein
MLRCLVRVLTLHRARGTSLTALHPNKKKPGEAGQEVLANGY